MSLPNTDAYHYKLTVLSLGLQRIYVIVVAVCRHQKVELKSNLFLRQSFTII